MQTMKTKMNNIDRTVNRTCKTCRRLDDIGRCRLELMLVKDCIEHHLSYWKDKAAANEE